MKTLSLLRLDPSSFEITLPGFPKLRFSALAEIDGEKVGPFTWKKSGSHYVSRNRWGTWKLQVSTETESLEVSLEARLSRRPRSVRLIPIQLHAFPADHVLTHGRKMGGCESHLLKKGGKSSFQSNFWLSLTRQGYTMQLSHPLAQHDMSSFSGETYGNKVRDLSAFTLFDPCDRKVLRSAPVTVTVSRDGHALLENWAGIQSGVSEMPPVPQESGWNSWDYYRWTITEEEVYRNAELIASDAVLSRHVKRIIVDDGWQYCYGEWEPNSLFPSGMDKLARNLKRMGFTPGLWFAPTIAEPHSRLAQLEPDTLAKGLSGYPCLGFSCMERKGFILDPTHPRVIAWWDELFRRYAGYGFRYFKLDFLAWTVASRTFFDRKAKPGELMRRIITPIRQAVGPGSRILGCNFNFEPAAGLVDDVRVSSDIHSKWSCVKENVAAIAARFWSHRRFWINDPDFTLCRGEETADDPDLHRLKPILPFVRPDDRNESGFDYLHSLVDLSQKEAEVLISLVIVSGGAMNLSDNLPRLNETGLQMLRQAVLAEKGNAAIPIDLFQSEYPSTWIQKLDSGVHRVLLVNWSERAASLSVDLAKLNVPIRELRNFWNEESVSISAGRLFQRLAPHSCLLVETKS